MKKLFILPIIIVIFCLSGCYVNEDTNMSTSSGNSNFNISKEPYIVNTFAETDYELFWEYIDESKEYILETYHELSDGTYKVRNSVYKYKVEHTGTMDNKQKECTYIILTNDKDLEILCLDKNQSSTYFDCFVGSHYGIIVAIRPDSK